LSSRLDIVQLTRRANFISDYWT